MRGLGGERVGGFREGVERGGGEDYLRRGMLVGYVDNVG